ncbi:MAG: DNA-3-methyladenine glycosylase I [Armatimonadota bacterium]|nr:DNA-3-methyladenine glycosylase I [Armatimonadota bacterium]MDR7454178.1 DNA-3-methyladenine glycosylase I [Armatimonadota bacterium]MDR7497866.1 DNA-3-methyladenine glycosylase I [Armatimonadota bacterium]
MTDRSLARCGWSSTDPRMIRYHDTEWGVPVHRDRKHFEFLLLDAFQAGLSWAIILRKRDAFRRAFQGFDPEQIARYGARDVGRLLADPGIVRNRLKVEAAITNARRFLEVRDAFGSFDRYVWGFVDGAPIVHRFRTLREIPARSRHSDVLSRDLQRRGFRFVGSVICYAYMQAAGLVNDHVVGCFRHREVQR